MEKRILIENEFKFHLCYAQSMEPAVSSFHVEFYHPKTGKQITYSEMRKLLDIDLDKRVERIEKIFSEN